MTNNSQDKRAKESFHSEDDANHDLDRRTFLKRTSQVAGTALAFTAVGSLSAIPVSAAQKSSVKKPKPDMVFPVISDVHIKRDYDDTLNKFQETLEQLNRHVPDQDALVVVGDLTDNGYEEEYDKFFSIYNEKKQSQAESMFAIGNHDYMALSTENSQKLFLEKTGMESMYYHKTVKGYHFIVLATEDVLTEGTFNKKQINWLDKQLQIAQDDDPEKPIFVYHHQPIKGTIYGSEWGFEANRDLFYNTLSKYPRAISFSGHTHYPLDDPRIIHQKDFTAIGTSTGKDLWLEDGRIQGNYPNNGDYLNQALIVEVYENKVIIKRRDIHNDDWTGEPFELNYHPDQDHQKQFTYTEDRDDKLPYFTDSAMASIDKEQTTNTSLTLLLTQAEDDLLVHDYRIIAKSEDDEEKEYLAFSEFYRDPIPNPVGITVGDLKPNTTYEFDVYAVDAFDNESTRSISVMGKTSDEAPSITMSDVLPDTHKKVDVKVENIREPQDDWIGLYEENAEPGTATPSIWWMYTPDINNGTFTFTYDPEDNIYPDRYNENASYKMVYFYGDGYNAIASKVFSVNDTNIDDMKELIDRLEKSEDIKNHDTARALNTHLSAVEHYEKTDSMDKALKHMKNFKKLLKHQKENQLITEKAYNELQTGTKYMINKWE